MENRYSFIVEVMANGKYIPAPLYELKELDMEDNKYFTPSIEDIRVGYECEINWVSGWKKHILNESLHVYSTHNVFVTAAEAIKRENLRVPYLTKEQIEGEGWQLDYSRNVSSGVIYCKNKNTAWYFTKDNLLWIRDKNDATLFQGECKSINEFKTLMKWLKI